MWPRDNAEFWKEKIQTNVMRDERKQTELIAQSWNVIIVWECELKKARRDETLTSLEAKIKAAQKVEV